MALAVALLGPTAAYPFAGGIAGYSADPTTFSSTCTSCHNAGTRSYSPSFSGALGTVAPGGADVLSFVLTNAGTAAPEAGFNLSIRRLTGTGSAGSLTAGAGQRVTSVAGGDSFSGELVHSTPQATSGGNASWSFTYTAPANVGTVRMHVCGNPVDNDGNSTGNDGPAACTSRDVTINSSPNSNADSFTVNEDSTGNTFNVLVNDTSGSSANETGDSIEVTHINGALVTSVCPTSVAVTNGTVCRSSTNPGNTLSFTPTANFAGATSFTYQITDSLGAISAADTVSITVTGFNDAPVANDDSINVDRNSSNNPVPVLTNDTDVDSTINVTQVNGSAAGTVATTNGSVTRTGNSLTYTPAAGYSGPDSFTYTISDGSLTDTATVNVTVNAVAIPDSATVGEDSTDNTINVLANDTLADGGRTLVSVTAPSQGGTAVIFGTDPNEVIRYTPAADFFGTETFTYTMTDSSAVQDSALVTVTVTAINDAPQITSSPITTAQDAVPYSHQVAVTDVDDANDGVALSWSLPTAPAGMTVSATGLIQWTPPIDVAAGYDVTVQVADGGENGTTPATQSFTINVSVPDSDSDGMPDSFENLHGFDPNDPGDATGDADGDGLTNLEEYQQGLDPTLDDVAPNVTVPADLVVPATGYLTVVDLGAATAIDAKDGAVEVTSNWTFPVVRPGRYTVTWTASDLAGNVAMEPQQVDVLPLADFNADQVSGEGRVVQVTVTLNGTPPQYPAAIPFSVLGTADAGDSDAVNGTLTIASGLSVTLPVTISADGAAEGTEQQTFSMNIPNRAALGSRTTHTITITDSNAAPSVVLSAFQGAFPRATAYQGDGTFTLAALASDPNDDALSYDWSGSADALGIDGAATAQALFDPSGVPAGAYPISVAVSDGQLQASAALLVIVAAGTSAEVDIDADGIPDNVDAITDYGALLENQTGDPALAELLEADPALSLRRGRTSLAAGRTGALISMSDIVTFGVGEGGLALGADSYDNLGGIFDFEIHGLAPGGTAHVVLPLQTSILEGAAYRKFDPVAGWHDFVVDANNAVASAHSTLGQCPGPNSDEYVAGLQPSTDCVRLRLEDGGPNDADGTADGVIRDPGGVAVTVTEAAGATVKVSSGAFLALLLSLAALLRLRRAGAALLALAALLAALPAHAEHHVRIHYSGDAATGFDDNVTNAQHDADIRESGFGSVNGNMDYQRALSLYSTLLLRGSAQYEYWNSFSGLNNAKVTGMARMLYRGDGDFFTPTFAAWLSVAGLEFDSAIRDGVEYRAGGFVTENLTTQITGRFALMVNRREAAGEVFDLDGMSASLNLDWAPASRMTVYTGYQFYDGGVASTATPTVWIVNAAEAIEADDAFGGLAGGLRAYRFDAQASIVTLGYNYAFTRKLSADVQGQYISTRADARNEYQRQVTVVSLLARF